MTTKESIVWTRVKTNRFQVKLGPLTKFKLVFIGLRLVSPFRHDGTRILLMSNKRILRKAGKTLQSSYLTWLIMLRSSWLSPSAPDCVLCLYQNRVLRFRTNGSDTLVNISVPFNPFTHNVNLSGPSFSFMQFSWPNECWTFPWSGIQL